nr:hypothetical protein [Tanacetum cinerariifolium]
RQQKHRATGRAPGYAVVPTHHASIVADGSRGDLLPHLHHGAFRSGGGRDCPDVDADRATGQGPYRFARVLWPLARSAADS